jgi:elongation factor G
MQEVLDLIVDGFPSPLLHAVPDVVDIASGSTLHVQPESGGDLVAEVIKTTSDPYVGRISLVRVYSGELKLDKALHVVGHFADSEMRAQHESDEKIGSINHVVGKTLTPVTHAGAGEIVAITKLTIAETGDTLSSPLAPRLMPMWQVPQALHPTAIAAASKADEDKVGIALKKLLTEDVCVRVERNSITHQTVLWTLGDAHLDVALHRLEHRYGVHVVTVPFRVPLLQTISHAAPGKGHLVKQSGGHGQYAICDILLEPGERGSGFEFVDEVVGGAVPRSYIPSVEHGISVAAERGIHQQLPLVDFRVRLVDGKAHSVDSSDMAFQQAGALALTDAVEKAGLITLEPIDLVIIETDESFVGAVLSDITTRRGRIISTSPCGNGRSEISAEIPQLELASYASSIRSVSHGTGRFVREFARYEEMPQAIAKKYLDSLA